MDVCIYCCCFNEGEEKHDFSSICGDSSGIQGAGDVHRVFFHKAKGCLHWKEVPKIGSHTGSLQLGHRYGPARGVAGTPLCTASLGNGVPGPATYVGVNVGFPGEW